MKVPHFNATGEKIGEVELDAKLFEVAPNARLIQQAVVVQQANSRQSIAHTKTRAEVRGGGRKPWKQKGTGRARHGSIRSPLWRGGGITFGPRSDRNFSRSLTIKARRKALAMILSDRAKDSQVIVVEPPALESPKTKTVVALLRKLPVKSPSLLVMGEPNPALVRSVRNAPDVTSIAAASLNVVDALKHRSLVLLDGALERMVKTFGR